MGLSKKNTIKKSENKVSYNEVLERSMDAGKQIYLTNKEEVLNYNIKYDAEFEQRQLESLMTPLTDNRGKILKEGLCQADAMKIIEHNRENRFKKK